MKTIKFTGMAILALLLSARVMAQIETKERQLVIPLSEPGKPYKLNVDLISSPIKVTGYDGKDIIIDVESNERKRDDHDSRTGMRRLNSGDNMDLTAREKNNTVTVGSEMPGRSSGTVNIKVPQQAASSIKLGSVNGHSIIISNVSGELEITSTNGFIQATDISGSVVANTVNGKVLVTFKSIDQKAPMAFSSLNGNIDVTFPAGLKANVKLKSDRGDVFSDFDMVTDKSQPKATKTVHDNMYRLSIEDWIYGKIDGGGPEMMMKTMNGNIYIRKAK